MKKFKLFLLAAVAVLPVLQSCNDSDVEGADSMALVTILNPGGLSGTFYFKADNGQTLYPSQFAVPTGGYNPEDGQRAFIYYSLLEEKSQQYDYNIKLYGISEILTKDVEEMNDSNEAEFGDEPIELVKLSGEDRFDCLSALQVLYADFHRPKAYLPFLIMSDIQVRRCSEIPDVP